MSAADLAFFVSMHNVETVKYHNYDLYIHLARWPIGNTWDCNARSPEIIAQACERFFAFLFVVVQCSKTKQTFLMNYYYSLINAISITGIVNKLNWMKF